MIERVKKLLLHPKDEWGAILTDPADYKPAALYVCIISLLPALALFLGYGFIGLPSPYGYFKLPLLSAFLSAFVYYFFSIIGVALTALMISFFAHYFMIESRWQTYLKLAAYSATAPILANIFYIFPALKFLKILGFYGCVTMFIGLQMLLKIPKEKEMQFVVTALVGAIVIAVVFSSLTDQFLGPIYSDLL